AAAAQRDFRQHQALSEGEPPMKLKKYLAMIALLACALPAAAQQQRARTYEFYMSPIFTDSKSLSFDGGASARTDQGYGFGVGFAYNFSQNLNAGVEL